eukprot:758417-Hanusia_phi.AAC.9
MAAPAPDDDDHGHFHAPTDFTTASASAYLPGHGDHGLDGHPSTSPASSLDHPPAIPPPLDHFPVSLAHAPVPCGQSSDPIRPLLLPVLFLPPASVQHGSLPASDVSQHRKHAQLPYAAASPCALRAGISSSRSSWIKRLLPPPSVAFLLFLLCLCRVSGRRAGGGKGPELRSSVEKTIAMLEKRVKEAPYDGESW